MRYLDTSFLASLILPEATSEPIAGFFESLPVDDLAVSDWTRVEFASLFAREVCMGGLDAAAAREAGSRFEIMVRKSFPEPICPHGLGTKTQAALSIMASNRNRAVISERGHRVKS